MCCARLHGQDVEVELRCQTQLRVRLRLALELPRRERVARVSGKRGSQDALAPSTRLVHALQDGLVLARDAALRSAARAGHGASARRAARRCERHTRLSVLLPLQQLVHLAHRLRVVHAAAMHDGAAKKCTPPVSVQAG
jgi:hypothetical protein